MAAARVESVEDYLARFPPPVRAKLEQLREAIRKAAPDAEEVISYQMPAYRLAGPLVYFAGYRHHVGFYAGAAVVAEFHAEVSKFKWSKGTVQFPLEGPLPLRLISRIVKFRVQQNLAKQTLKAKRPKTPRRRAN